MHAPAILMSILVFSVTVPNGMQVFAQEEIIDSDELVELSTPKKGLSPSSPLHFLESIGEAFELATANPEERPLIKIKHAEKRLNEIEQLVEEGRTDLLEETSIRYKIELESARKEMDNSGQVPEQTQLRKLKIDSRINEKLLEHEDFVAGKKALTVLERVKLSLAEKGVDVPGIDVAISRVTRNIESGLGENKIRIKEKIETDSEKLEIEIRDKVSKSGSEQERMVAQLRLKSFEKIERDMEKADSFGSSLSGSGSGNSGGSSRSGSNSGSG